MKGMMVTSMKTKAEVMKEWFITQCPFLEDFKCEKGRMRNGIRLYMSQESKDFSYTYIAAVHKALKELETYAFDEPAGTFINKLYFRVSIEGRQQGIYSDRIISPTGWNIIRKAIQEKKTIRIELMVEFVGVIIDPVTNIIQEVPYGTGKEV